MRSAWVANLQKLTRILIFVNLENQSNEKVTFSQKYVLSKYLIFLLLVKLFSSLIKYKITSIKHPLKEHKSRWELGYMGQPFQVWKKLKKFKKVEKVFSLLFWYRNCKWFCYIWIGYAKTTAFAPILHYCKKLKFKV